MKLTPEQQKKLDTIQALLRKAKDSGVTDEEAELLTAKAFSLATQYMIDEAFIYAEGNSNDLIESRKGEVGRPYLQLLTLANTVYTHFGCRLVQYSADPNADISKQINGLAADGTKYRGQSYGVTGFTSDLDLGLMLLTSLLVQGSRQVVSDYRNKAQPGERRSTYYRSWWSHFTAVIYDRLHAMRQAGIAESNRNRPSGSGSGAELVLASRKDLVDRKIAEQFGKLKKGSRSRGTSGSGASAGAAAGRRADLGGKKVGGSTQAIGR